MPPSPALPENVGEMRAVRPIVWPAYVVAAVCLAFALIALIFNIWLNEELRQSQVQALQLDTRIKLLDRELAIVHTAAADLIASDARHFDVPGGQVVTRGTRLYLAMSALAAAPKGKVYQVWILHVHAAQYKPSVTFLPNRNGIAVVPIPTDATVTNQIAMSLEPESGSKHMTGKPIFVVELS